MISPRLLTTLLPFLPFHYIPSCCLQLFVLPSCCELIQFLSTDKTSEFSVTMRQLNGNNNKKNNCNSNNNATATTSITMATLAIIMDDAACWPRADIVNQKGVVCLATLHIEGNGDSDSNLVSISLSNNASPRWQSMVQCLAVFPFLCLLAIACSFCLLS